MSGLGFRVSTKGDTGLAPLRKRVLDSRGILNVGGRAGRNALQKHLRAKNTSSPNKLGGQRTNFYAKAADAVNFRFISNDEVVLSINAVGIALRYYGTAGLPGGRLTPVSAKYLTIPATAEAHGKRAGEFGDLEVGYAYDPQLGRERLALVRREATVLVYKRRKVDGVFKKVALPGGKQGGEAVFWLVRSVKMEGDETVLPTEFDLIEAVVSAVEEFLGLLDERAA
ncbi:MAG: hypothetical protein WC205_16935 [Opitutaceae bacterium]|jgi:hypothetical protein